MLRGVASLARETLTGNSIAELPRPRTKPNCSFYLGHWRIGRLL